MSAFSNSFLLSPACIKANSNGETDKDNIGLSKQEDSNTTIPTGKNNIFIEPIAK